MKNHRQQTYYDILGIRRDASTQEVRIAYQRLVRHHHPDRTGGDTIEIVILNEAYEVLKDPTKRKAYDQSLLIGRLTSEDLEALGRRMGKQVKDNLSALKDGLARVTRYTAYDRRPQASERPASGDIHLNLHADIWQVALGHIVAIDTGYEILHLKLPAVVDAPLRILGKGHPSARGGRGDVYVHIHIKPLPTQNLMPAQRQAYAALEKAFGRSTSGD